MFDHLCYPRTKSLVMMYYPFYVFLDLIGWKLLRMFAPTYAEGIGADFLFLWHLPHSRIWVMLASYNEWVNVSMSLIFWKSLCGIGIISSKCLMKPSTFGVFFVGRITVFHFLTFSILRINTFCLFFSSLFEVGGKSRSCFFILAESWHIRQSNILLLALFVFFSHSLFSVCFKLCCFYWCVFKFTAVFFSSAKSVINSTQLMFHFTYCIFMYRNFILLSYIFMFMFYVKSLYILSIFIIAVLTLIFC